MRVGENVCVCVCEKERERERDVAIGGRGEDECTSENSRVMGRRT